jgi:hypothetical protein
MCIQPERPGGDLRHNTEHESLLRSERSLLDRFMFEGDELRNDGADLCLQIDDALPPPAEVAVASGTVKESIDAAA